MLNFLELASATSTGLNFETLDQQPCRNLISAILVVVMDQKSPLAYRNSKVYSHRQVEVPYGNVHTVDTAWISRGNKQFIAYSSVIVQIHLHQKYFRLDIRLKSRAVLLNTRRCGFACTAWHKMTG